MSEEQREFLRDNASKVQDLIVLTRRCFGDDTLDGRSRQGRAVRKFLVENSIDYKTTSRAPAETIEFTDEQVELY